MKKVILLYLALVLNSCVVIKYDCVCKPIKSNFYEPKSIERFGFKDNPNILLMETTTVNDSLIKKYQWYSDRLLTNKHK